MVCRRYAKVPHCHLQLPGPCSWGAEADGHQGGAADLPGPGACEWGGSHSLPPGQQEHPDCAQVPPPAQLETWQFVMDEPMQWCEVAAMTHQCLLVCMDFLCMDLVPVGDIANLPFTKAPLIRIHRSTSVLSNINQYLDTNFTSRMASCDYFVVSGSSPFEFAARQPMHGQVHAL